MILRNALFDFFTPEMVLYFGLVILLLFVLRFVNLWYWKIDIMVKNQEEQIRLLKKAVGEKEIVKEETVEPVVEKKPLKEGWHN